MFLGPLKRFLPTLCRDGPETELVEVALGMVICVLGMSSTFLPCYQCLRGCQATKQTIEFWLCILKSLMPFMQTLNNVYSECLWYDKSLSFHQKVVCNLKVHSMFAVWLDVLVQLTFLGPPCETGIHHFPACIVLFLC